MKREPGRTCLGCRRVRPKRELVRLVRGERGIVVADARARARGRGADVCPDAPCLEQGLSRKRLAHAFRGACELAPELAAGVRLAASAATSPIDRTKSEEVTGTWPQR